MNIGKSDSDSSDGKKGSLSSLLSGEDSESNILNNALERVTTLVEDNKDEKTTQLISERRKVLDQKFITPTNRGVIDDAKEVLIRAEQEKKAREKGEDQIKKIAEKNDMTYDEVVENLKVEFDIRRPEDLIVEFGLALESIHDELVQRIDDRNGEEDVNPIIETEDPTMTQIVGKPNVGKYGNVTILHGGRNIIYHLSEQLGFNEDERELIQLAHRIAARRNGLHRFVLVNDIIMIETDLSLRVASDKSRLQEPDL